METVTIYKLKHDITEEDLKEAGYIIVSPPKSFFKVAHREDSSYIIIPLEACDAGERVIQYDMVGSLPEELDPEDIEDLISREWVEPVEVEEKGDEEDCERREPSDAAEIFSRPQKSAEIKEGRARYLLNRYRNAYYNSADQTERELAQAIDVILPQYTLMKKERKNILDLLGQRSE